MPDFVDFAKTFGLPLALLAFALITGSMGKWHFKGTVDALKAQYETLVAELKAQYDARLRDKDQLLADRAAQIEGWRQVSETNAQSLKDSLLLARETKDTLARVERELGGRRARDRETPTK